jgi:hypothetical protein
LATGTVVGLYPNGDLPNSAGNPADTNGGHYWSAGTDFGKGAGGATNVGTQTAETTSWQSLQNPLSTTIGTNFIADKSATSTERIAWTHDAMPSDTE